MPQTLTYPEWPPYSPYINPIENVWGWLKHQVAKDMPKSVKSLKASIRKYWNLLDEAFLAPYFNSMPERLEMIIENEGGKINY